MALRELGTTLSAAAFGGWPAQVKLDPAGTTRRWLRRWSSAERPQVEIAGRQTTPSPLSVLVSGIIFRQPVFTAIGRVQVRCDRDVSFSTFVDVLRSRATAQPDGHAYTFLVDGEDEWTQRLQPTQNANTSIHRCLPTCKTDALLMHAHNT